MEISIFWYVIRDVFPVISSQGDVNEKPNKN